MSWDVQHPHQNGWWIKGRFIGNHGLTFCCMRLQLFSFVCICQHVFTSVQKCSHLFTCIFFKNRGNACILFSIKNFPKHDPSKGSIWPRELSASAPKTDKGPTCHPQTPQ
jgi:hypothetical protein